MTRSLPPMVGSHEQLGRSFTNTHVWGVHEIAWRGYVALTEGRPHGLRAGASTILRMLGTVKVDYEGRMARVYDAGRTLDEETLGTWMRAASHHLRPEPKLVLDLGAGTGRFSGSLAASLKCCVVAVEPAQSMRSQALHRVAGSPVHVVAGEALAIPLKSGSAHGVWASQVLHHVKPLVDAAREMARVLEPGGRLLVRGMYGFLVEQMPLVEFFPRIPEVAAAHFPSWEDMRRDLETGGFTLVADECIRQTIAGSLAELHTRVAHRADSALELLNDDEFDQGLQALARTARERPAAPVTEELNLFVFELH